MNHRPRLLALANYYYPENASVANLYTELCESLTDEYDVTAVCEVPCYTGTLPPEYKNCPRITRMEKDGVQVWQVRVKEFCKEQKMTRVKHVLSYFFNALHAINKVGRQDLVLAVSQPPVLGGLLGLWAKWRTGAKLIYNIQDFNPEQIEVVNYSGNQAVIKILRILDNFVCRRSDAVVVVSGDMQKTLHSRLNEKKVPYNVSISNWVDVDKVRPLAKEENPLYEKYGLSCKPFQVVYAGNIGLMQNLQTVLDAAEQLKAEQDIQFILIGNGAWKEEMLGQIESRGLANISTFPLEPLQNVPYVYAMGDVGVVSIAPGVTTCSMPSKTWNILAAGRPVVCQVDEGSELQHLLEDNGLGLCSAPGDGKAMAENILRLREAKSNPCRDFACRSCSRTVAVQQYRTLLHQLHQK